MVAGTIIEFRLVGAYWGTQIFAVVKQIGVTGGLILLALALAALAVTAVASRLSR